MIILLLGIKIDSNKLMITPENEKLSLKRKIVLSLGLLVAAMILIFAQQIVVKAKPENDAKNNRIKEKSIQPKLDVLRELEKTPIDSLKSNGSAKKMRKNKFPEKNSNTNSRLFESI